MFHLNGGSNLLTKSEHAFRLVLASDEAGVLFSLRALEFAWTQKGFVSPVAFDG